MAKQTIQINARVIGFILLYVMSIFFVINSVSANFSIESTADGNLEQGSIPNHQAVTGNIDLLAARQSSKGSRKPAQAQNLTIGDGESSLVQCKAYGVLWVVPVAAASCVGNDRPQSFSAGQKNALIERASFLAI